MKTTEHENVLDVDAVCKKAPVGSVNTGKRTVAGE